MGYRSQRFALNPIWTLIGINLLVFIATMVAPSLVLLFGLLPAAVLAEPWTIVTSLFIHGSFWHVALNMLTFYFFGTYLLQMVGTRRFLTVYFGAGITASIFYILITFLGAALSAPFLGSPLVLAVGSSGAIFGLGGALTALRPNVRVIVLPIPAPLPLWVAVIGGFLVLSLIPGIAWQAHLGGLLFGLVAGYFLKRRRYSF